MSKNFNQLAPSLFGYSKIMNPLEFIHTRRSIRKYEDRKVPDKLIIKILAAGMSAPSAGNEQPWQFIVITEKSIFEKVPYINRYAAFVKNAPAAILICGDLSLEKHRGFWVQDCSATTQNMLLAAHTLGLGAVWTGIYPRQNRVDGFKKLFNIPDKVVPFALIPI